jgi:hypothetical protein
MGVVETWSSMPVPRKLLSVNNGELWYYQCQVFAAEGLTGRLDRIDRHLGARRAKRGHGHWTDEDRRWRSYLEQLAVCRPLCVHHL